MSNWNYVHNGQSCGPVETAALLTLLREGTLPADTLVWREGMSAWVAASTLPEFAAAPPPGGGTPPVPNPNPPATDGTRLRIAPAAEPPQPPKIQAAQPTAAAMDPDAEDIEKNKVFAVLAYLGLLFLVPLLAAPQSKFARYHTNQGVVLFIAALSIHAGCAILMFIPFVNCLVAVVAMALGAGTLGMMILGIINAATGKTKPLPFIGHFQLIK